MPIRTGLDVLLADHLSLLKGQRVGLVTNPTGVTSDIRSNVDVLLAAGIDLVALFGPEHGLAAAAPDATYVASGRDARTGLPIHSLYGDSRRPTPEMLSGIDALVVDLQDVGVRFYTFIVTMGLALQACAEYGLRLVILDRPNPINGLVIEGAILDRELQSFIGHGPLPIRHGLTMGELAGFYNSELGIGAELNVIPMQGWKRDMWFDQTGLPWVPPSPGIPHFDTTVVYPGTCLIEGTNLSEGRGTALPFEIVVAPWLDGDALAEELNARRLGGVRFRPVTVTPAAGKFAGQACYGVQVHVTERTIFRPVSAGLHVLAACKAQRPDQFELLSTSWEGEPPHLDLLAGTPHVRQALIANESMEGLVQEWEPDLARFDQARSKYYLY